MVFHFFFATPKPSSLRYMLFNPHSPTGHYKLDLSNTGSAYVAQALALLDRWESGLAKRKDLVDISENGEPGQGFFMGLKHEKLAVWTIKIIKIIKIHVDSRISGILWG